MELVGGLDYIILDYFKPYRVAVNKNRFELGHILYVVALPLAASLIIAWFASAFIAASAGPIVAVYAIMASVMTAIMPTINGLVGPIDRERVKALKNGSDTSDSNIRETRVLIAKVEIVRGLYAAVAWSVILLCMSLLPLLVLCHPDFQKDILIPPTDIGPTFCAIRMILVAGIAFSGSTAFIALVQIVSGIHLMTRHSQVDIESGVRDLKDHYRL